MRNLGTIDGINMWPSLISGVESPRSEILLNIDPVMNYSAIRRGDLKYILGDMDTGDEWYGDSGRDENKDKEGVSPAYDAEAVLKSKVAMVISGEITLQQASSVKRIRNATYEEVDITTVMQLTVDEILQLRSQADLKCRVRNDEKVSVALHVE